MSSEALSGDEGPPACRAEPPLLQYWEIMWNRLHEAGWRLGHTTWTNAETGGVRHYVYARRGGNWVESSAPTMTETVTQIAQAARETEQNPGALQRHQDSAAL